jgi:hypothetical protein
MPELEGRAGSWYFFEINNLAQIVQVCYKVKGKEQNKKYM